MEDHEYQDSWWKKDGQGHSSSPPVDPYKLNIKDAEQASNGLHEHLKANPDWIKHIEMQNTRLRWVDELSGEYGKDVQKSALEEMKIKYPNDLKHIDLKNITETHIQEAKDFIHNDIHNWKNQMRKLRHPNMPDLPNPFLQETTAVEAPSFSRVSSAVEHLIEGHHNWMARRSAPARWAFVGAEIGIGSAFALKGYKGFSEALNITHKDTYEMTEDQNGKKSLQLTKIEPISARTRVLHAALGVGGMAVGVGTMVLAMGALFRRGD